MRPTTEVRSIPPTPPTEEEPVVYTTARLPADSAGLVLFVEPRLERREVFQDRAGIHLFPAGEGFQRLRPWPAHSHLQHFRELLSGCLVPVNRAAVQRPGDACRPAQRAVKLELENVRQEVAHVRHVRGNVVFRAGIEIRFAPRARRPNPLILQTQLPPGLVVVARLDLPRKNSPAP